MRLKFREGGNRGVETEVWLFSFFHFFIFFHHHYHQNKHGKEEEGGGGRPGEK